MQQVESWVWRNQHNGTALRMASVLVWTTYVVAAVVVVLYGLAAGFVAFLRCAMAASYNPNPKFLTESAACSTLGELYAAQCISNMHCEC